MFIKDKILNKVLFLHKHDCRSVLIFEIFAKLLQLHSISYAPMTICMQLPFINIYIMIVIITGELISAYFISIQWELETWHFTNVKVLKVMMLPVIHVECQISWYVCINIWYDDCMLSYVVYIIWTHTYM